MTVNRDPTVDIILGSAVRNMHRSKPDLVQRSGIQVSEISEKSRRNWRTWNVHQDWRKRMLKKGACMDYTDPAELQCGPQWRLQDIKQ